MHMNTSFCFRCNKSVPYGHEIECFGLEETLEIELPQNKMALDVLKAEIEKGWYAKNKSDWGVNALAWCKKYRPDIYSELEP